MGVISALEFLQKADANAIPPVCVVSGDEAFLRTEVIKRLRALLLSEGDAEFSFSRFDGATAPYMDVLRETSTMVMFGTGKRLVLVEQADPFVSQNKERLEDYIAEPSRAGILVLQLASFPSNLRLYKKVSAQGLIIDCKALTRKDVVPWLVGWASKECKVTLSRDTAETLVELLGEDLGALDQETRRLALLVPPGEKMTQEFVTEHAGSWRQKKVWDLVEVALEGKTSEALRQLDKLVNAGEVPIAILAQMAYTVRKLSAATQLFAEADPNAPKLTIGGALDKIGVKPFLKNKTTEQLKKLGSKRGLKLSKLLLQTDIDLKGGSKIAPRHILEQFIVQISNPELKTYDFETR